MVDDEMKWEKFDPYTTRPELSGFYPMLAGTVHWPPWKSWAYFDGKEWKENTLDRNFTHFINKPCPTINDAIILGDKTPHSDTGFRYG